MFFKKKFGIGISNISEEALLYVADELQFRLRTMIQTASKHTRHSSTNKFTPDHLNSAIKFHFGKRAHNYRVFTIIDIFALFSSEGLQKPC